MRVPQRRVPRVQRTYSMADCGVALLPIRRRQQRTARAAVPCVALAQRDLEDAAHIRMCGAKGWAHRRWRMNASAAAELAAHPASEVLVEPGAEARAVVAHNRGSRVRLPRRGGGATVAGAGAGAGASAGAGADAGAAPPRGRPRRHRHKERLRVEADAQAMSSRRGGTCTRTRRHKDAQAQGRAGARTRRRGYACTRTRMRKGAHAT